MKLSVSKIEPLAEGIKRARGNRRPARIDASLPRFEFRHPRWKRSAQIRGGRPDEQRTASVPDQLIRSLSFGLWFG